MFSNTSAKTRWGRQIPLLLFFGHKCSWPSRLVESLILLTEKEEERKSSIDDGLSISKSLSSFQVYNVKEEKKSPSSRTFRERLSSCLTDFSLPSPIGWSFRRPDYIDDSLRGHSLYTLPKFEMREQSFRGNTASFLLYWSSFLWRSLYTCEENAIFWGSGYLSQTEWTVLSPFSIWQFRLFTSCLSHSLPVSISYYERETLFSFLFLLPPFSNC